MSKKKPTKTQSHLTPEQAAYHEANDAYQSAWRAEVAEADAYRKAERAFLALPRTSLAGRWQSLKQAITGRADPAVEAFYARKARLETVQGMTQGTLHVREQMYRIINDPI